MNAMHKCSFLSVISPCIRWKDKVWSKGNITHQLTDSNLAGFATYEQRNRTSWLSFTVIFSGLTVTIGGSERKQTTNGIKQKCRLVNFHTTQCVNQCDKQRGTYRELPVWVSGGVVVPFVPWGPYFLLRMSKSDRSRSGTPRTPVHWM